MNCASLKKGLLRSLAVAAVCLVAVAFGGRRAEAGVGVPGLFLEFDTELLSLDLNVGSVPMPLGPGWADMATSVHVGLSMNPNKRSLGKAYASQGGDAARVNGEPGTGDELDPPPIDPNALHGQQFFVNSFFDVFFDITVTDVDPVNNFGGAPDGAIPSLTFPDNGPAHMENFFVAVFDKDAPNFGLIPPPEAAPYIGHFNIEIPLGADLNGNGELDKIKFTLVAHTVGDENRTFIILPDGTVIDTFDSTADLSGAVVDASQDPPFTIGLSGPTTASSHLRNGIIPEPASIAVWGLLSAVAAAGIWRKRRAAAK